MGKRAGRNPQTQHKPQRDSDARERRLLAKELERLRREVSRLTKERDRLSARAEEHAREAEESVESMAEAQGERFACDKCQSTDVVVLKLPLERGKLLVCKTCKHRRKL